MKLVAYFEEGIVNLKAKTEKYILSRIYQKSYTGKLRKRTVTPTDPKILIEGCQQEKSHVVYISYGIADEKEQYFPKKAKSEGLVEIVFPPSEKDERYKIVQYYTQFCVQKNPYLAVLKSLLVNESTDDSVELIRKIIAMAKNHTNSLEKK